MAEQIDTAAIRESVTAIGTPRWSRDTVLDLCDALEAARAENSEHLRTIESLDQVVDRMNEMYLRQKTVVDRIRSLLANPNAERPHTDICVRDGYAGKKGGRFVNGGRWRQWCACQEDSRDPADVLRQARAALETK